MKTIKGAGYKLTALDNGDVEIELEVFDEWGSTVALTLTPEMFVKFKQELQTLVSPSLPRFPEDSVIMNKPVEPNDVEIIMIDVDANGNIIIPPELQ